MIQKPVFTNSKAVFYDIKTGFFMNPKPFFYDPETGFLIVNRFFVPKTVFLRS